MDLNEFQSHPTGWRGVGALGTNGAIEEEGEEPAAELPSTVARRGRLAFSEPRRHGDTESEQGGWGNPARTAPAPVSPSAWTGVRGGVRCTPLAGGEDGRAPGAPAEERLRGSTPAKLAEANSADLPSPCLRASVVQCLFCGTALTPAWTASRELDGQHTNRTMPGKAPPPRWAQTSS